MTGSIEFYFDFSSPFGFIASTLIDELAAKHGHEVVWRPYLIGAVYKEHGGIALEHPLKKDYVLKDAFRTGRFHDLYMTLPEGFPQGAVPPSRVFYWIEGQDKAKAAAYAKTAYHAYWIDGRSTADPEAAVETAVALGFDREAVAAGMQEPAVKERLKDETATAMAKGVFGSPFFFVDGEPFWGGDRLAQMERWMEQGSF